MRSPAIDGGDDSGDMKWVFVDLAKE